MADPCVGRITHQCHLIADKKWQKIKKKITATLIVMGTQLVKDYEYSETSS